MKFFYIIWMRITQLIFTGWMLYDTTTLYKSVFYEICVIFYPIWCLTFLPLWTYDINMYIQMDNWKIRYDIITYMYQDHNFMPSTMHTYLNVCIMIRHYIWLLFNLRKIVSSVSFHSSPVLSRALDKVHIIFWFCRINVLQIIICPQREMPF